MHHAALRPGQTGQGEHVQWTGVIRIEKITSRTELDIDSKGRLGWVALQLDLSYSPDYSIDLSDFDFESIAIDTQTTDPDGADVSERVIELET